MTSVETSSPTTNATLPMSVPLPRVGDDARDGRGGRDGGGGEVDLRLRVPHPPLEVPVRRGDRDLAVAERPLVDAEARAAAGVHDDGARLHEVGDEALLERGLVDASRGGEDEHPGPLRDLLPADDVRGRLEVVEPAVRAGADDDLLDRDAGDLRDRLDVVDRVRAG